MKLIVSSLRSENSTGVFFSKSKFDFEIMLSASLHIFKKNIL